MYCSFVIATYIVYPVYLVRQMNQRGCGRLLIMVMEGINLIASDENGKESRQYCHLCTGLCGEKDPFLSYVVSWIHWGTKPYDVAFTLVCYLHSRKFNSSRLIIIQWWKTAFQYRYFSLFQTIAQITVQER